MSLTALCAARLPNLPYQAIGFSVIMAAVAAFYAQKIVGPVFMRLFDAAAPELNHILPTGWVPSLFQCAVLEGNRLAILLIVPVALILFALKNSLDLLKVRPKFQEFAPLEPASPVPKLVQKAVARAGVAAEPEGASLADIEEVIRSRRFLARVPSAGWLEKQAWRCLSAREKALAEFAFPSGFRMTKAWVIIFRNFSIMTVLGFAAGMANLTLERCIFVAGLVITLLHGLLQILTNGAGLRAIFCSGVNIPLYAPYSIGFRELSRTLFKVSAIQFPLYLAIVMAGTQLAGLFVGLNVADGVSIGFRIGSLIFAGRFIVTTMAFSSHTNDSSRFHARTLGLIAIMLGCVFLFLGLGAVSVLCVDIATPAVAWICWFAAIIDAYAFFRIYGWFYDRNYFDLMNVPRQ